MGQGYTETGEKKERMEKKKKAWEVGEALDIRGCFILPFFSSPPSLSLSSLAPPGSVPDYRHLLADRPLRTCSFRFNVPVFI